MSVIPEDDVLSWAESLPVPETRPKKKDPVDSTAAVLDEEFTALGYPGTARLSILGDVGRENNWDRNTIFKGHSDPKNQSYNRGIISWQGDRRTALDNFLKKEGVLGRNDDDELRGMARFMDKELREKFPDIHQKLLNPKSTYDASEALRRYIKYVPDAPYNSPDPEFRVKNNAEWAKRARKLGLGQELDLNAIWGDVDSVLTDPETVWNEVEAVVDDKPIVTPTVPGQKPLIAPGQPLVPDPNEAIQDDIDRSIYKGNLRYLPDTAELEKIGQAIKEGKEYEDNYGVQTRFNLEQIKNPNLTVEEFNKRLQDEYKAERAIQERDFLEKNKDYAEWLKAAEKTDSNESRQEFNEVMKAAQPVAQQQVAEFASSPKSPKSPKVSTTSPATVRDTGRGRRSIPIAIRDLPDENIDQYLTQKVGEQLSYETGFQPEIVQEFIKANKGNLLTGVPYTKEEIEGYRDRGVDTIKVYVEPSLVTEFQNFAKTKATEEQSIADLRDKVAKGEGSLLTPDWEATVNKYAKWLLQSPFGPIRASVEAVTDEDRQRVIDENLTARIKAAGSAQEALRLAKEYDAMGAGEKTFRHLGDFASSIGRAPATFARTLAWAEDTVDYLQEKGPRITLTTTDLLNGAGWLYSKIAGKDVAPAQSGTLPNIYAEFIDNAFKQDPYTRDTLAGKLATGAGSAVPFLLGAAATGGSNVAVMLLGAGMSVGEQYKQAKDEGLSREKQILSGLTGIPLGMTEAVGLKWAKVGEVLQTLSKGKLLKSFTKWAADTGKEFTEEALQEYFQSTAGKVVIEGLKNDGVTPEMVAKAMGSSLEDGLTGGIVGLIFGGGAPLASHVAAKVQENAQNETKVPEPSPSVDAKAVVSAEEKKVNLPSNEKAPQIKAKTPKADLVSKEIPPADVESGVSDDVSGDTKGKKATPITDIREPSQQVLNNAAEGTFGGRLKETREEVDIDTLEGGVNLTDKQERARVDKLKEQIASPDGFIERIIIDDEGNVIEGQHRLEAMRELGHTKVPVVRMSPVSKAIPNYDEVVKQLHSQTSLKKEQARQMVDNAAEILGDNEKLEDYEPPQGFEKEWGVLQSILGSSGTASSLAAKLPETRGTRQIRSHAAKLDQADLTTEKGIFAAIDAINGLEKNWTARNSDDDTELKEHVNGIRKQLKEQGYDVVDLLGQRWDDGMKLIANFKPDDSLYDDEEIITRIIQPQVNKDGVMVRAAKVEVSQGSKPRPEGGVDPKEQKLEEARAKLRGEQKPPAKDADTQETKAVSPEKDAKVTLKSDKDTLKPESNLTSPIRSRTRELGLIRPKESKEIAPSKLESSASSDVSGEAKVEPKEPWQMTPEEWSALSSEDQDALHTDTGGANPSHSNYHQVRVQSALHQGQDVPRNVLDTAKWGTARSYHAKRLLEDYYGGKKYPSASVEWAKDALKDEVEFGVPVIDKIRQAAEAKPAPQTTESGGETQIPEGKSVISVRIPTDADIQGVIQRIKAQGLRTNKGTTVPYSETKADKDEAIKSLGRALFGSMYYDPDRPLSRIRKLHESGAIRPDKWKYKRNLDQETIDAVDGLIARGFTTLRDVWTHFDETTTARDTRKTQETKDDISPRSPALEARKQRAADRKAERAAKKKQEATVESAKAIAVPRSAAKRYSYADEVADQIASPEFKEAEARSARETESSRTGFTKTQTEWLAKALQDYAKEYGDAAYEGKSRNFDPRTDLFSSREEEIKPEIIAVPDDGVIRITDLQQANRLHQMVTGKPLKAGLPVEKTPRAKTNFEKFLDETRMPGAAQGSNLQRANMLKRFHNNDSWNAESDLNIPIEELDADYIGGKTLEDSEWSQVDIQGRKAFTDGYALLALDTAPGKKKGEQKPDANKFLDKEIAKKPEAVSPVRATTTGQKVYVEFDNGAHVDFKYYNLIRANYPNATFRGTGLNDTILVYDGKELVGAMMPLKQKSTVEKTTTVAKDATTQEPLRAIPSNPLDGIITKDGISYERVKDVARRVESGELEIRKLDPAGERGRIAGGRKALEATIFLASDEARRETSSQGGRADVGPAQQRQEKLLEYAAKATGDWYDWSTHFGQDKAYTRGGEAFVYRKDDNHVLKTVDYRHIDKGLTPLGFLDNRIALFNTIFPDTKYELVGYTRDGDGKFRFVVKQVFIDVHGVKRDDVIEYMRGKGFEPTSTESYANKLYQVHDLHEKNAAKDADGTIYVIDAVPKLNEGLYQPFDVTVEKGSTTQETPEPLRSVPDENFGQSDYTFKESDYRPSVVEWAKEKFGDRVAPNGKPVYQNFVKWFDKSVVVDERGHPMLMWHGTPTAGFVEFEKGKIGKRSNAKGIHFTNQKSVAATYSGTRDEYIPPTKWEDAGLTVEHNDYYGEWTVSDPDGEILEYYGTEAEARQGAQALIDTGNYQPEDPGNYAGYISLQPPVMDVDLKGGSWADAIYWNETKQEYVTQAEDYYGNNDNFEYSEEDGTYTNDEGDTLYYEAANINDLVRSAADMEDAGVLVRNVYDDGGEMGSQYTGGDSTQAIIFDSKQFKSLHNLGNFSPEEGSILKKQPENRADLNELKTKYLDELAPDVKTEYKGENVVEINAEASEVIRTALAAVQDTKREAQAVVGSLFTEPQNAAGLIEAIDEIGIVLDENGIDTKQVKALVKNIEKASDKDGTVIFDGGGLEHEKVHYSSWKGADGKLLVDRYANIDEIAKDKDFIQFWGELNKLQGKSNIGVAAEEALAYLGSGDYARFGLTEEQAVGILQKLVNGYAEANGVESLRHFEAEKIYEAIENLTKGESSQSSDDSRGAVGEEREAGPRPAEAESDAPSAQERFAPGGPEKLSKTPSTLNKGGIPAQQRLYTSTTNEERQAFANERMDEGVDEAQKWVEDQIRTNNNNAGATGVVGINVMMQLGKEGRIDELNKFADDLLPQITDAAQMVQAVSIVSMFSPETAGVYVTKVAKKNGKDVTPEQVKKAVEIAQNMSEIVKTDGLIEAELEKAETLNKQYAQDVKDLEAALGIMTGRAEMAEADAKKLKGKLSGQGRTIAALKRKLEGVTPTPRVAREVAKKAKDIAERRSEIIDAIVAKYGANPVLRMVAPTSEGVFRQVPPTDNTAEIEWTIDQLINQKALTEKTPEQVKDELNTVTNGGLTEAQIDEIYAQAVSEIQVKREALDDEHKAAQKARNAHYRASRQHYDAITEKYFPKTKVEGMDKAVAAIIRVGVEEGFSDEAIWLTLYRRVEPDVNKQLKALREEFPDMENERHVLAESARLKQLAADRIKADRAQSKYEGRLTEQDIDLFKEEKRVNTVEKQKLVREANRFYEGLTKGAGEIILDTIVQMRRANLLTAVKTHFVNIGGNIGMALGEEIGRYPATAFDLAASVFTGERTTAPSPKGILKGFQNLIQQDETLKNSKWDTEEGKQSGIQAAYHIWKYGGSPADMERLQHSETVIGERFPKAKFIDTYIQTVFRTLGAEDAVFKVYAFTRHIHEQARAIALTEHRKDRSVDVKQRTKELISNPTNAMQVMADRYAHLMTFQDDNPLSNFITSIKRGRSVLKAGIETIMPYDRTPTNIVIRALEYSPVGVPMAAAHAMRRTPTKEFRNALTGPIRKDLDATEEFQKMDAIEQRQVIEATLKRLYSRQQQERFAKTMGRASVGTGMFSLGFVMAAAGLMAGAMNYDDDDRKESKETGRRKGEGIDNGSIYTPIGRITLPRSPFTTPLVAGATFYEQMQMSKKSPVLSAMDAGVESFADIISEQPLISSTTNTVRPLVKGKFGEFGGNLLSGYVPASAMVRSIAEVGDPVERTGSGYRKGEKLKDFNKWLNFQARGFRNSFFKGIPMVRNYAVDPSNNPSPGRGGVLRRVVRTFDPFNTRPVNSYSPPPGKVGVDNYLKSSEFKSASTDDLVDALMNEEYDSSDKAKMQNALKQKARNARKAKSLTQEEVDRIKKVLPDFNITANDKKR